MKMTVQRRLEALELRARQKNLDAYPPGYAKDRLLERLAQIRSRMPPEQLLAYQCEGEAEKRQRVEDILARLRAWRDERREASST
jgi:hypothetical protein